jgi:hypothetical protein
MFLDALTDFLDAQLADNPYLRKLWAPAIGMQIVYTDTGRHKAKRIPWGGSTRQPWYDDTAYHPDLTVDTVKGIGVNGWDWCDQQSQYVSFDLDSVVNHTSGLAQDQLDAIVDRLMAVPDAEIVRSKSGHGYHVRVYFDPQPRADTHTDHARNARRVLQWLGKTADFAVDAVDVAGGITWIWHRETGAQGFELIKGAS